MKDVKQLEKNLKIVADLYKRVNKDTIIKRSIPLAINILFLDVKNLFVVMFLELRSLRSSKLLIKPFSRPILRNLFFL